jgi:hypothetical protein
MRDRANSELSGVALRQSWWNDQTGCSRTARFQRQEARSPHVHDPPPPDHYFDAGAVHCRPHRLRARPLEALWEQRRRVPQGASARPHEADVTEGSAGIWERLHYDWSDPNRAVLKTTDSNVWGGASGHIYTFTRRPDGTTEIDVVVIRDGKNLKGRLLGFVVGTIGKGVLEKAFVNSVKAIEVRNNAQNQR